MSDEQNADQKEQARLDDLAAQNEAVRRAEHPEEFAHEKAEADADEERRRGWGR